MKKVFASNFNITMSSCTTVEQNSSPSVELIHRFQEEGNMFGLCTALQAGWVKPYILEYFSPNFLITSRGANILDADDRAIRQHGISPDIARRLVKDLQEKGFHLNLDIDGMVCVFSKLNFPSKYFLISNLDEAPKGLIHQIRVETNSEKEAAQLALDLSIRHGDQIETFSDGHSLFLTPRGGSLRSGLESFRRYLKRIHGDYKLYAIGNSMVDLPLMELADVSYTFPNAPETLKKRATKIVSSMDEALRLSMD